MRERLVGFGHTVNFLALLHRRPTTFGDASRSSAANRCPIDFSERLRAASRSQRIDKAMRRAGRTSTGTW
jgi:hypothetical protein